MQAICSKCRYFAVIKDQAHYGVCRRNPPQVVGNFGEGAIAAPGAWPITGTLDFCGEFRPRIALELAPTEASET